MDRDSMGIKEVYAVFGLVIYIAQSFERQLAITLASALCPGPTRMTRRQYENLLEENFKKTLGQLYKKIQGDSILNDNIKGEIEKALEIRNFLTHNYFWERAVQFNSSDGRKEMLKELHGMRIFLETIDSKIEAITKEWGERHGVTEEVYRDQINKLLGREK